VHYDDVFLAPPMEEVGEIVEIPDDIIGPDDNIEDILSNE